MWNLLNAWRRWAKFSLLLVAISFVAFLTVETIAAANLGTMSKAVAIIGVAYMLVSLFALWMGGGLAIDVMIAFGFLPEGTTFAVSNFAVSKVDGKKDLTVGDLLRGNFTLRDAKEKVTIPAAAIGTAFFKTIKVVYLIDCSIITFCFFMPVEKFWPLYMAMLFLIPALLLSGSLAKVPWEWKLFHTLYKGLVILASVLMGIITIGVISMDEVSILIIMGWAKEIFYGPWWWGLKIAFFGAIFVGMGYLLRGKWQRAAIILGLVFVGYMFAPEIKADITKMREDKSSPPSAPAEQPRVSKKTPSAPAKKSKPVNNWAGAEKYGPVEIPANGKSINTSVPYYGGSRVKFVQLQEELTSLAWTGTGGKARFASREFVWQAAPGGGPWHILLDGGDRPARVLIHVLKKS